MQNISCENDHEFYLHENKTSNIALSLALKKRLRATREWPRAYSARGGGGGVLLEFMGGDVPLGPNPPYPRVAVSLI